MCPDGEEEELLEARAVLKDVAAREHQKGEDQELFFYYAGDVSESVAPFFVWQADGVTE